MDANLNTRLPPTSGALDVLIVGGGPTGMTAALELTRHGLRCRVVDKAARHKQHSQAGVLWARTQEVYDAMGILGPWEPRAVPLHAVSVRGYGKWLGEFVVDRADSPRATPMQIGQNETEELLEQACARAGCPVERQVEAVGFAQDADGVHVTLRHLAEGNREETAHAAWLVAGDGAGSGVRGWLGLPWDPQRFAGQHVFQIDAKTRWELPVQEGHGYFFMHDAGYFGCVPLPDGYRRFFVSEHEAGTAVKDIENPTLEEMADLVTRASGFRVEFSEPRWLSGKRYQNVITSTFRVGRALLAGDAGRSVVPFNAQGMNTGIQDVFNLGWKLAAVHRGDAPDALLDTYVAERHAVAEQLVKFTGGYFTHATDPSKWQATAVRLLGGFALSRQRVQETYAKFSAMLHVTYRGVPGALAEDHGPAGAPVHAGDRAPDAWVTRADTRATVSLFGDVFRGTHWTLLLLGGAEADADTLDALRETARRVAGRHHGNGNGDPADGRLRVHLVLADPPAAGTDALPAGTLLDYAHNLHARYAGKPGASALVLVRPDGHVGFRGGPPDAERLLGFLARTLLR